MSVGNLSGDSIHVGGSLLGESLSIWNGVAILGLVVHFSNKLSLLQLNQAVSDAFSGGLSVMLGEGSLSLLSTVVLSESVDSDLLSHVQLVGNGGSSNVKPVWVIWGEVSEASSLRVVGPLLDIIIY